MIGVKWILSSSMMSFHFLTWVCLDLLAHLVLESDTPIHAYGSVSHINSYICAPCVVVAAKCYNSATHVHKSIHHALICVPQQLIGIYWKCTAYSPSSMCQELMHNLISALVKSSANS